MMFTRCRTLRAAIACAIGCMPTIVFGAADCDRGSGVAADIFEVAEEVSVREQCRNLEVSKPVLIAASIANPAGAIAGGTVVGASEILDEVPGVSQAVDGAQHVITRAVTAGCMVYKRFESFAPALLSAWNDMAANKWATFGPRQIEFDSIQSGTVVNPSKRTFVSAIPLDSDSVSVTLTKKGGRASTEVVICSHSPSGGTRLEHNTVIAGSSADGFSWEPQRIDGVLDHIISVQIAPSGLGRQLGYTIQVNKGPVVQPVPEPVTATETPEEVPIQTPGDGGIALPGPSVSGPEIQTLPDGSLPQGPAPGDATPAAPVVPAPVPTTGSGLDTPAADVPTIPSPDSAPAGGGMPSVPSPIDDSTADRLPPMTASTSGQCIVTSTMRFPGIRLRCGLAAKDEVSRVSDDFMADCPLIAGDSVNVELVEGEKQLRITGRASGGEWCNTSYRPGYYTGPCDSQKSETSSTTTRTLFYQGRKIVGRVIPGTCNETKLGPGIYRIITERREDSPGSPADYSLREGGLRLDGDEMVGDVSNLLSQPIQQR